VKVLGSGGTLLKIRSEVPTMNSISTILMVRVNFREGLIPRYDRTPPNRATATTIGAQIQEGVLTPRTCSAPGKKTPTERYMNTSAVRA